MDYILFILAFFATIVGVFANLAKGGWSLILTISSILIAATTLYFAAKDLDESNELAGDQKLRIDILNSKSDLTSKNLREAQTSINNLSAKLNEISNSRKILQKQNEVLERDLKSALLKISEMSAPNITYSSLEIWHDCKECKDELLFENSGGTISSIDKIDVKVLGRISVGDRTGGQNNCPFLPLPFASPENYNPWKIDFNATPYFKSFFRNTKIRNGEKIGYIEAAHHMNWIDNLEAEVISDYIINTNRKDITEYSLNQLRHCFSIYTIISINFNYNNSNGLRIEDNIVFSPSIIHGNFYFHEELRYDHDTINVLLSKTTNLSYVSLVKKLSGFMKTRELK